MTARHTPAPWEHKTDGAGGYNIVANGITIAATTGGCHDDVPADVEDCNARLIAAAPDLLAALQYLVDDIMDADEDRNPETGEEYDSVTVAREALAKAKGDAR